MSSSRGARRWWDAPSLAWMSGPHHPYGPGGDPLVPRLTPVRQRLTGAWATLRPPDAMLVVCGELGSTAWRDDVRTSVTTRPLVLRPRRHGHTASRPRPPRAGMRGRAAASGHARARRPWRGVALLLERLARADPPALAGATRGQAQRPVVVLGSGGSRPDTPALQATGGGARSNGARGPAGTGRLWPRRPPGPPGQVARRQAPTPHRGTEARPGGAPLAQPPEDRHPARRAARPPHSTASRGAARPEPTPAALPVDAQPPAGPAAAVGPARAQRLTSCHSRKTPYLGRYGLSRPAAPCLGTGIPSMSSPH
jgi:hypothetical protein